MPKLRMSVCGQPNCPTLIQGPGKCDAHKRTQDRARGSSSARGYDYSHQKLRREWKPKVEGGAVMCGRCKQLIHPQSEWDLGHDDGDRTKYTGPEHLACNRATAGRH